MKRKWKGTWLKWSISGAVLGGVIAVIGFWIFEPQTNSFVLFISLRMFVGMVVAVIAGPMLMRK